MVLAVRDSVRGAAAVSDLSARTGNRDIDVVDIDLASLESVREAAAMLTAGDGPPVRALINNAGLQLLSSEHSSVDGFELTFAVNHLGPFLLTRLLLDSMMPGARVLIVSSATHYGDLRHGMGMPGPRWQEPRMLGRPRPGAGRVAYVTSKLANLYFAYELARRHRPSELSANGFDPGLMPGTALARDAGAVSTLLWQRVLPSLRHVVPGMSDAATSGAALARLAVDPQLAEVSGRYFQPRGEARSSEESYDGARAQELWEASEEMVGLV